MSGNRLKTSRGNRLTFLRHGARLGHGFVGQPGKGVALLDGASGTGWGGSRMQQDLFAREWLTALDIHAFSTKRLLGHG